VVLSKAANFVKLGLKAKDALHISCAIEGGCNFFISTDDLLLKKIFGNPQITAVNPIDFIKIIDQT
jgi:predicted nucleic acid-binding protein